jgi:hypothetical protein
MALWAVPKGTVDLEVIERLEDYVSRRGQGRAPSDGRKPGWLIRDIEALLRSREELAQELGVRRPSKMTWRDAWGLFDRRKK